MSIEDEVKKIVEKHKGTKAGEVPRRPSKLELAGPVDEESRGYKALAELRKKIEERSKKKSLKQRLIDWLRP